MFALLRLLCTDPGSGVQANRDDRAGMQDDADTASSSEGAGTSPANRSLPHYLFSPGCKSHAVAVTAAGGTYCIAGDALVTYANIELGQ